MWKLVGWVLLLSGLAFSSSLLASQKAVGKGEAAKTYVVQGLEIDAPQKRTRPGVVRITAKVEAKAEDKVKILWDVTAQFEDEDVEFEWDKLSDQKIQVIIPDSKGIISISAWALLNGEPTSEKPAKTTIDVVYIPRDKTPKSVKAEGKVAEKIPVKETKKPTVYLVADLDTGDPNIAALINSSGLRNRLKSKGFGNEDIVPVDTSTGADGKLGLISFIDSSGGAPCALVVKGDKVVKSLKLTKTTTIDDIAKLVE